MLTACDSQLAHSPSAVRGQSRGAIRSRGLKANPVLLGCQDPATPRILGITNARVIAAVDDSPIKAD